MVDRDEWSDLHSITARIRKFVDERDWGKFHTPAALAISSAVELGELLELFQWKTETEIADALNRGSFREALSDEIADVMIYLLRLADVVGIDIATAIREKLRKNEERYRADKFYGTRPADVSGDMSSCQ